MAEDKIRISTIIPIYNAEKYLERCLDSVLNQGLEGCEVICVDDGSSDGSFRILERYAKNYSNFNFIKQQNRHAGVARNIGLQYAKGLYIHFLDADDYLFPDFYQQLSQILVEQDADYIRFRNQAFDMQTNEKIKRIYYSMDNLPGDLWGKCVKFELIPEVFLKIARAPWTGIVKREFLIKNNILFNDLLCCNDRSFYAQVIYYAQRILLCNLYGVYHQVNNKNSLVGIRKLHFECQFYSYSIIESFLEKAEQHIKQQIMGGELQDLISWYETLDRDEKCRWSRQLYEILKRTDIMKLNFGVVSVDLLGRILDEIGLNPLDKLKIIYNEFEIIEMFSHKHAIYLYGAGKVAEAFWSMNNHKEWWSNILGVLVTTEEDGKKNFHGLSIDVPKDDSGNKDKCIVVATSRQYQLPIYCNLCSKGYRDVVLFSETFCNILLEKLNDRTKERN